MGTEDCAMIGRSAGGTTVLNERMARPLTLALVNNMSGAWATTERQFRQIIAAAAIGRDVQLQCFRGTASGPDSYRDIEALFDLEPDGIVVTGAEPKSKSLSNEPLFNTVIQLARWAEVHGTPVIWSCLAAHAAVLYLDGIDRQPRDEKLCGVFRADVLVADHPLLRGIEPSFSAPHSRWNGLSASALQRSGYRILAHAKEAGVDFFEKTGRAPFTFFQSHPEYEADSLLREFRRDLRRYQLGEASTVPGTPKHYLSATGESEIAALCTSLRHDANNFDTLGTLLSNEADYVSAIWAPTSVAFYRNWLDQIMSCGQHDLSWHRPRTAVELPGMLNMDTAP